MMGLGKHGVVGSFAQQFWLMPPLMSTHWPAAFMLTHAEPVQSVPHVPQPGLVRLLWPGHGGDPPRVEVPVVTGRPMGMVPAAVPPGAQSGDSV
jgi:hypothetical protein